MADRSRDNQQPQSLAADARGSPASFLSAGEWIEYAIEIMQVPAAQLLSKSRRRHLTLPRAFIGHHGRALGFSLAELAHRLARHPASLLEAIERTGQRAPDLLSDDVTRLIAQRQTARLQQVWRRHASGSDRVS